jgi:DNA invertase Pin-like site-specific DNA recombinase
VRVYAELYDLEVVAEVEDAGVSAKTLARPGLARVLAMLENGEADGVLVCKLDRLTRSVRDLGDLVDRYFAGGKWALLSVAENVDTRSAAGRLVLNVLASVAQWERETCAERTVDALAHLKREGVRLGGEALGWRRSDGTDEEGRRIVEDVEAEAETVARIRTLKSEGRTVREIAVLLTAEGRRTKRGGRWHPTTVQRVLARTRRTA